MKTIGDLINEGKITLGTVVLGELPMTADGCVVGFNSVIWHCDDQINISGCRPYCCGSKCWRDGCQSDSGSGQHHKPIDCYSTPEAAEKARSSPCPPATSATPPASS